MTPKKSKALWVEPYLHQNLKNLAINRNTTIQELIKEILIDFLEKENRWSSFLKDLEKIDPILIKIITRKTTTEELSSNISKLSPEIQEKYNQYLNNEKHDIEVHLDLIQAKAKELRDRYETTPKIDRNKAIIDLYNDYEKKKKEKTLEEFT